MQSLIVKIFTGLLFGLIERAYNWFVNKKTEQLAAKAKKTERVVEKMKEKKATEDRIVEAENEVAKRWEEHSTMAKKLEMLRNFNKEEK